MKHEREPGVLSLAEINDYMEELRRGPQRWPVIRTGERAPIPWLIRLSVYLRDDYICATCGRSFEPDQLDGLHLDHLIPWSAGGSDDSNNLRALCADCNLRRSNWEDRAHTRRILPTTWWCGDCWTHERRHSHRPWANGIDLTAAPLIDIDGADTWQLAFCATCRYINSTPHILVGATGRRLISLTTPRSTDASNRHNPLLDT